jgi:hypothetical protein
MSLLRATLRPRWLCLLAIASCCAGLAKPAAAQNRTGPRVLAPGVLTVIPPALEDEETYSGPVALVEITEGMKELEWTPHFLPKSDTIYARAQSMILRRNVWGLELAFKPLRMMYVDVPQPTGKLERKLIWYMVFRVRNPGRHLAPEAKPDAYGHPLYSTGAVNFSRHFFPQLVLKSHEFDKEYLDRIIPTAIAAIQQREDPNTPLHSTVEISKVKLDVDGGPDDRGVWGVATWEDVDPRLDFLSVYVQGLTNAYKFADPAGAFKQGDPPGTGRIFATKTLQLNFWRPGDIVNPTEEEIRYGLPTVAPEERLQYLKMYGQQTWVDYQWVYR